MARRNFDPIAIFPSRIATEKPWKALSAEDAKIKTRGASNGEQHLAAIPLKNTAYERHVRYHESLHGLYSPQSRNKKDFAMRGQALEDARLHLTLSRASGTVRRDELAAVEQDLRTGLRAIKRGAKANSPLNCLIGLRAMSHLFAEGADLESSVRAKTTLENYCRKIDPSFYSDCQTTLDAIRRGDMAIADSVMTKYIPDNEDEDEEVLRSGMWPGKDGDEEDSELADDVPESKFTQPAPSSVVPGAGGDVTKVERKFIHDELPELYIRKLFAIDNVKTYSGSRNKRALSGVKIKSSRLAMVVGPGNPRIFERVIHRDGGSVLIDASGSMRLTPDMLLELVKSAPLATIAMYNSQTDSPSGQHDNFGNLWIYSQLGRRAQDFSGIRFSDKISRRTGTYPKDMFGSGNLVDYPAMQWLLTQSAPRFFLTDKEWTGSRKNRESCDNLFQRCIAQRKFTHVYNIEEMQDIFARRGKR